MARKKWFLPYKANRLNYEDVGAMPYLVKHDIGFSGDKLFQAVKWNGPNSGTFTLVGEVHSAGETAGYGQRAKAADTRKARAKAVADARRLAGVSGSKQNPVQVLTIRHQAGFGYYIMSPEGIHLHVRIGTKIVSYFSTQKEAKQVAVQLANTYFGKQNPSWRRTVKRIKSARKRTARELGERYEDFPSRMKQVWKDRRKLSRTRTNRRRY